MLGSAVGNVIVYAMCLDAGDDGVPEKLFVCAPHDRAGGGGERHPGLNRDQPGTSIRAPLASSVRAGI